MAPFLLYCETDIFLHEFHAKLKNFDFTKRTKFPLFQFKHDIKMNIIIKVLHHKNDYVFIGVIYIFFCYASHEKKLFSLVKRVLSCMQSQVF